jgi:(S)-ureidoglycine-glyoxylate aminotransferase
MGPGPVNAHPRVLRAMSADLLGQFDPEMTGYMNQVMALYRPVFGTQNQWTMLIDGTARAAIEASLVSLIQPGEVALVVNFGRFGLLLQEILTRIGARFETVDAPWGEVVPMEAIREAALRVQPRLICTVHGDTSTTMAQPLDGIGAVAREVGALVYVDATATLGGMEIAADRWGVDVVTGGLQKCLGGPSGSAPITVSDAAAEAIFARRHDEKAFAPPMPSMAPARAFLELFRPGHDHGLLEREAAQPPYRGDHHALWRPRMRAGGAGRGAGGALPSPQGRRRSDERGAARHGADAVWR